jgi:hypothetical protein
MNVLCVRRNKYGKYTVHLSITTFLFLSTYVNCVMYMSFIALMMACVQYSAFNLTKSLHTSQNLFSGCVGLVMFMINK